MDKKKQIVLVTGSDGFVGSHFIRHLSPEYILKWYDLKRGQDILDKKTLTEAIQGCNAVVHLAAYLSVPESHENPEKYYRNNIEGTERVFHIARDAGVERLVFASSCAARAPDSSPYAFTKHEGEKIGGLGDMKRIALRFFNIYGQGQSAAYAGVISKFREGIRNGEITINGDGEQTRDYISVEDICRAIECGLKSNRAGTYDIGTGYGTNVNELAKVMTEILGRNEREVKIVHAEKVKEMRHAVADITLADKELGFKSRINLREGLEKFLCEAHKRSI